MVRGKRLYVTSLAALIVVLALMATAAMLSGWGPRGISDPHPLSDAEQDRAVDLALGIDAAKDAIRPGTLYSVRLGWVYIYRDGLSRYIASFVEEPLSTVLDRMPAQARLYVLVELTIGNPPAVLLGIAVNPETGVVANVESHPLKTVP